MGIDIGTTRCKAVIFNEAGQTLTAAYREYPLLMHSLNFSNQAVDRG